MANPLIGTAGWAVPPGPGGSRLQRYAAQLDCVEINSSFRKTHRPATYRRWAESVPASFQFSLKLPHAITHGQRLLDPVALLDQFLRDTAPLGEPVWLVQLPPSLKLPDGHGVPFFPGRAGTLLGPGRVRAPSRELVSARA